MKTRHLLIVAAILFPPVAIWFLLAAGVDALSDWLDIAAKEAAAKGKKS